MSSPEITSFRHIEKVFEKPVVHPANVLPESSITQYFYESIPYHGKTTRVYACCSLPDGASPEHPVPGVVLVHGGGGTAFYDWVKVWNQRGYAAISMDTCGKIPCWAPNQHCYPWPAHEFAGPSGYGRMEEAGLPPEEQWVYHAVCAVIAGHSLLRSLPGVDPDRIGISGISWGGMLTCVTSGLDDRFRFAIPVYGCGFFHEKSSALCRETTRDEELINRWFSLWDPGIYLANAKMPFLFLSGTNDFAFPVDAQKKSFETVPAECKRMCMIPAYPHDHTVCWTEETIFNFAESALNGIELPSLSETGCEGSVFFCSFSSAGRKIRKAEFCWTRAEGYWQDRRWNISPAKIGNGILSSDLPSQTLPEGISAAYFMIEDSERCRWSSSPFILK